MVKAFLTIKHGHDTVGTLHLELYDQVVPKTVQNFTTLLQGQGRLSYKNSISHRLIPGFMAQFGDITKGDGTGGESIYGTTFDDENFTRKHDRKGMLSMANSGPHTNGSQFFVTFRKTPHLDNKHVVFGHVDLDQSASVLYKLEKIKTDSGDKPLKPVVVIDCGVVLEKEQEEGEEKAGVTTTKEEEEEEDIIIEEEDDIDESTMTKSQALKHRMRKLKMKMNQARQLNRKALRQEGEAMGSAEGKAKVKKQQNYKEKQQQKKTWQERNAKAVQVAGEMGIDSKYLAEPASSSLKSAAKNEEQAHARKFSTKDYYNPEGQHRNYERNVRNIQKHDAILTEGAASATFNPMMDSVDPQQEREGARRLANELHRRIEKTKKRKQKIEYEETDVTYINKRNKMFNKAIARDYDKATAEIKQNLERGTAL